MGLSSALATAMSGLRANQAALSITSSNIANAQTAGYVTESANQVALASGGYDTGVQTTGVNRELDTFVQNQLWTETGGSGYADQTSNILGQLQSVYGTPGGTGTRPLITATDRCGSHFDASRSQISFIDAGQITIAG